MRSRARTVAVRPLDRFAPPLVVLTIALIVVAVVLRFWSLGLQPYWVDETWSIGVASLSLPTTLHTIKFEVHPPTFQLLLWLWIRIGGVEPEWTRLLPGLFGAAGVFFAYWLLRVTPFTLGLRLLWVASVAVSGMAIVYAQEVRSYSLAWCAAVGLTAMTLRMTIERSAARRDAVLWIIWGAFGSSLHLFNTILVVAAAIAIGLRWRSRTWRVAGYAAIAVAPQALWLLFGKVFVPDFAGGSSWIPAPGLAELAEAATTIFAVDRLHWIPTGFVWTSPVGVWVVLAAVLIPASVAVLRARRPGTGTRAPSLRLEWNAAIALGSVALGAIVMAWVGSQFVHVWTVRNLIVVQPAVVWFVVTVIYALGRRLQATTIVASVLIALLTLNLVWIAANLSSEYKPPSELRAHCCHGDDDASGDSIRRWRIEPAGHVDLSRG